jgi:RHH-type proline utilization regulon transcriptional repressor/proline dehydrogenase/delta 1-pyrroline-5-carboxylate dehydrogenase
MGQVVAAVVAGNTVLAKPAEQTTLVAFHAVKLLHEAGIPGEALQLLLGPGEAVGTHLVHDERVKGVMFTGSTETAKIINQSLASRSTGIVPFIAETGGQNAMLVDSSALFEQVVKDVIDSAFGSAGQRCSALRVLYLQDDIADEFLHMLKGAMADIKVGDPINLSTDVGPVIDQDALDQLEQHLQEMDKAGKLIYQCKVSSQYKQGSFFAPCAFEIKSIKELRRETFGPFLHVVRFSLNKLDKVLDDILATGFGLTGGVHSRISQRIEYIAQRMRVGNLYVNRNTIGAVVGVQPFGGQGLSGTGPKAGGPNYLHRLVTECTLTVDTTASGGNASLLTLSEEED